MQSNFRNKYTAIACVNTKGMIGSCSHLLYNIKADLENFKLLTEGNVVIMGRATFESLPGGKPLKNRINIILTTNTEYLTDKSDDEDFSDTYICNSFEEVDNLCYSLFPDRELFIIGGGIVFLEAFKLGMVDKAIVTLVNDDADGDTQFYDITNDESFKVIFRTMSIRDHQKDEYYRYIVYKKKDA